MLGFISDIYSQKLYIGAEVGFNALTSRSTVVVDQADYQYIDGSGMTYLGTLEITTASEDNNAPGIYFSVSGGFTNTSVASNQSDRTVVKNWKGTGRLGLAFVNEKVIAGGYLYASGNNNIDRLPTMIEFGLGSIIHYQGFNSRISPIARFEVGVMSINQAYFEQQNSLTNPFAVQLTLGITHNL